MTKDKRFGARVDEQTMIRMDKLDAEINLKLLPQKTTKGERIEIAQKALIEKLEGGKA